MTLPLRTPESRAFQLDLTVYLETQLAFQVQAVISRLSTRIKADGKFQIQYLTAVDPEMGTLLGPCFSFNIHSTTVTDTCSGQGLW